MAFDSGSVDMSGFKKKTYCGGRQYDEFSNFFASSIWAEEDCWPTAEHYYQALKFPGEENAHVREELRSTTSPMECWKLGNLHRSALRQDWEVVKLDMMYLANFLKFCQNCHLRNLLVNSEGPIRCDGGIFWANWNAVILERVRESLMEDDQKDSALLDVRVALFDSYREAARSDDQRSLEAVTLCASKRQLPLKKSDISSVILSGTSFGEAETFTLDLLQPEINGQPHWVSSNGWHLYLAKKHGKVSWVVDEVLCANEATGYAFKNAVLGDLVLPCGAQVWQCWDECSSRHVATNLLVTA